jgi:hypothetical protein
LFQKNENQAGLYLFLLMSEQFYFWDDNRSATRITIAIDMEWYDQTNGSHLKEIGLAIQPDDKSKIYRHFIIKEHQHLINRYSKENPKGFKFGESEYFDTKGALFQLRYWLSGAGNNCPVDLLFHNGQQDKRILQKHRIDISQVDRIIDTGDLVKRELNESQMVSLSNSCNRLGILFIAGSLHNAGNDAAYTLEVFNKLCIGN